MKENVYGGIRRSVHMFWKYEFSVLVALTAYLAALALFFL